MMFDRPDYVQTLHWLGSPQVAGNTAWIERPVAGGGWDARGSWPYGSLPGNTLLDALDQRSTHAGGARSLLTWTGVVRPDCEPEPHLAMGLRMLAARRPLHWRVLKDHLAHLPNRPSARAAYSLRTRRRLREATDRFEIEVGPLREHATALAAWQDDVRHARRIPHTSSPDASHFAGLERLGRDAATAVCVIAVRHRHNHELCGAIVAVRSGSPSGWHAHSALCSAAARGGFAAYLLFDTAIDVWGRDPVWWGGQPAGAAGAGVWRFKQRFANHSAPAHLLSIDLDPEGLREVRAQRPSSPWLPDYRDPAVEMALTPPPSAASGGM